METAAIPYHVSVTYLSTKLCNVLVLAMELCCLLIHHRWKCLCHGGFHNFRFILVNRFVDWMFELRNCGSVKSLLLLVVVCGFLQLHEISLRNTELLHAHIHFYSAPHGKTIRVLPVRPSATSGRCHPDCQSIKTPHAFPGLWGRNIILLFSIFSRLGSAQATSPRHHQNRTTERTAMGRVLPTGIHPHQYGRLQNQPAQIAVAVWQITSRLMVLPLMTK